MMIRSITATLFMAVAAGFSSHAEDGASNRLSKAHAHYAAGVIHEQSGESGKALAEFHKAALLDPGNESLALEVSGRFLEDRQPEKALDVLTNAAARADVSGLVLARLGAVYSQLDRTDEAIRTNRRAVEKSPGNFQSYQNLCLNYLQRNQTGEAFAVLQQAARRTDADAEFLVSLAEFLVNFSQQFPTKKPAATDLANDALTRAAKLNPTNSTLRLKLADGFNTLGNTNGAEKIYRELLGVYTNTPSLLNSIRGRLAGLYVRVGNRAAAMEQLEAILADDPTNPQICYQLGGLAYDDKQLERAAEFFRKATLLRPDFEPAYYELAQTQLNLDRAKDALATLEQAREKFTGNFVNEFLAGMACSRLKDFDRAIAHFTTAEVMAKTGEPQRLNGGFYYELGSVYERKGDLEQAEKCLKKSLELSPNFDAAQNYLGYMWADRGVNLPAAREFIEKALKAEPKNPAYLDSLGWVLFKLKQPREALVQIQKAIELSEKPDATLLDHLGDIYAALNQPGKAREAWQKSLAVEPSDAIRKKLDSTPGK